MEDNSLAHGKSNIIFGWICFSTSAQLVCSIIPTNTSQSFGAILCNISGLSISLVQTWKPSILFFPLTFIPILTAAKSIFSVLVYIICITEIFSLSGPLPQQTLYLPLPNLFKETWFSHSTTLLKRTSHTTVRMGGNH